VQGVLQRYKELSPGFNTDNSATCFGYMPNSPVDAGANTHFASPE
jgi:hypothetical protein